MIQDDYTEVLTLLMNYHDGLYRIDTDVLRDVFSPTAQYATIADGSLLSLSIDEYLERLEQRTAPADRGEPYRSRVHSIRFAAENTALAEVESSLFGHDYTDLLSLLRIDGQWRVQAKVFEGAPRPVVEAQSCHM